MAFKPHSLSPPLLCRCDGEKLYVCAVTGDVEVYTANLGVEIEEQCNYFTSKYLRFVLERDGVAYIGRYDGTWSAIRVSDGLLLKMGTWYTVPKVDLTLVGTHVCPDIGSSKVYLDKNNRHLLYTSRGYKAFVLKSPLQDSMLFTACVGEVVANHPGLHIITREGVLNEDTAGTWFVSPVSRRRNHRFYV